MKLSACLIVKDEQATLKRCLDSLRPVSDEIVVVDTGSKDGTPSLAAALGARVHEFPWADDFSVARNFSLAQARHPWILVCDADEALDPTDYPELRGALAAEGVHGYEVTIRNYVTSPSSAIMEKFALPNQSSYSIGRRYPYYIDHRLIRLFRNDTRIRFSGRIHETVDQSLIAHGLRVAKSPLVLHHFGKLDWDREKEKRELYLLLAKRKYQEQPHDFKSRFDYAIQLFVAERFAETAEVLQATVRDHPLCGESAYVYLGRALHALERFSEAAAAFRRALEINPHNPLTHYFLGEALRETKEPTAAADAYRRAAELGPHLSAPYLGLSNLAWWESRRQESLALLRRCAELDPRNPAILELLAARLISTQRYEEALPYCHSLIREYPEESDHWFVFLTLYYHKTGDIREAIRVLREGLAAYPDHARLRQLQQRIGLAESKQPPA